MWIVIVDAKDYTFDSKELACAFARGVYRHAPASVVTIVSIP